MDEITVTDNSIIIISADLSSKKENVLKSKSDDEALIDAMDEYVKKFKTDDVEIFEQHNNILITEQGYYLSVFARDLNLK